MNLCRCGCGKEVSKEGNEFIQGHNAKLNPPHKEEKFTSTHRENLRTSHLGHGVLEETRTKIGKKLRGRKKPPRSDIHKKNLSISIKEGWKDPNNGFNSKERSSKLSRWMLGGHAVYMNSKVRNPSKSQVHIYKETMKIFPEVYLNYPVYHLENQASIDVAIPKLDVAIEYNGARYHQDPSKDKRRQKMLEEDGWKFIIYEGTLKKDFYPTKEQIQKDISGVLRSCNV
jgi:hypothetical protein